MRHLAYDLLVTIGVLCGVATGCILLGTATGAVLRSAARPAVLNVDTLPDDTIIIFDWDHQVTWFVRTKAGPKSPRSVAEPLSRADLARLDVCHVERMAPEDCSLQLRDVDSGALRLPTGIWFWSVRDGVETGTIGGVRFINARFPEVPSRETTHTNTCRPFGGSSQSG